MEKKLDLILSELKTVKEEINSVRSELHSVKTDLQTQINSLKTKMDVFESNQLTFLQELREQPLENPASEKIYLNEFNRIHESIKFVNRCVADIELEVYEVKCQLKRVQKS